MAATVELVVGERWLRTERSFPCASESIADARQFVVGALEQAARPQVVDAAQLVVSELATNAVTHAASTFDVEIAIGAVVRLAVSDRRPGIVAPLPLDSAATSGRGLAIIAALADRWGVDPFEDGKRVWWEVEL